MRGITSTLVATGALPAGALPRQISALPEEQRAEALVDAGLISDEQLAEAVSVRTGVPRLDLGAFALDPAVVALVPAELCRRHRLIPVRRRGDRLTVGLVDASELRALDDVASVTGLIVDPVVVTRSALQNVLARYVRSDDELSALSSTLGDDTTPEALSLDERLGEQDSGSPVVRFVNLLISQAIIDRASDVHVEPGERELTVRYRIDGVLHVVQRADRSIQDGVISRLKIMSSIDIADRRRPQDGRLTVQHDGRRVDLRVATLPTVWGEKVTMRILDTQSQRRDFAELGLSETNRARLDWAISRPFGMVLVTGPTGSGKSTTLYAAVDQIAAPEVSVVSVEDPVEFRIDGITQVQVNAKAGLTFAGTLRAILRIDPDVILVGEIRDKETASTAIDASLTGHLLLSTLHTNDAPSALTRLVEIGAEAYLVGSALTAVVGQRLTRRLCELCREPVHSPEETLNHVGFPFEWGHPPAIYRARGCSACAQTGYRGRIALHEVMTMSERLEHEVLRGTPSSALRQIALEEGMLPLRSDGWAKVAAGLTSIEEVLRVTA